MVPTALSRRSWTTAKGSCPVLGSRSPGLQGTVAQGLLPPPGHHLHRHAPFKDILILKPVDRGLLGGAEFPPEGQVLLLGQGAVDVIRRALAVAGRLVGRIHIDALSRDNRRGGIVKVQEIAADLGVDGVKQRIRGQRA